MPTFVPLAQVNVSPTSAGMPGAELINQLISWLSQLALWGSLASILVGAAIYGLSKEGGHGYNAAKGRMLAAGGAVGAILAGLAPTIVNMLFRAAS
jgi:hypothetical protein